MAHWREAMSQPSNLWRPQQFYTGNIGALPEDAPGSTASDWKKGAHANGKAETLLASSIAEKAVKDSHEEPAAAHQTQALMAEVTTQAQRSSIPGTPQVVLTNPHTSQAPAPTATTPLVPVSAPVSAASAIASKDGSKTPRVVTFEIPASSAAPNKDDSKTPRFVTLEIPASLASHAPTTVPANDVTVFALEG